MALILEQKKIKVREVTVAVFKNFKSFLFMQQALKHLTAEQPKKKYLNRKGLES